MQHEFKDRVDELIFTHDVPLFSINILSSKVKLFQANSTVLKCLNIFCMLLHVDFIKKYEIDFKAILKKYIRIQACT